MSLAERLLEHSQYYHRPSFVDRWASNFPVGSPSPAPLRGVSCTIKGFSFALSRRGLLQPQWLEVGERMDCQGGRMTLSMLETQDTRYPECSFQMKMLAAPRRIAKKRNVKGQRQNKSLPSSNLEKQKREN